MKIAVFNPLLDFTLFQQKVLSELGEIVYIDSLDNRFNDIVAFVRGSEILAVNPDFIGGFEKAKDILNQIMESLPKLRGLALFTNDYGWVDLDYCRRRSIVVSNLPSSAQRESIAEHTIALLLCLAKRIITTDRATQKGKYKLEIGFELKGKTLGVIGLGSIGSRVAEIGNCFGMRVIAFIHSPKKQESVEMKGLDEVLKESDAISINVTHNDENKNLISKEQLDQMKEGVIIVNTADREIVDEGAMAEAINSGKVFGYAYEVEDLNSGPLANLENAIGLKGFGWYTKETLENLFQIWVDNIVAITKNKPENIIN